ncbi:MAG: hypothetical protein WBO25_11615, partial [Acidimicrobiia bacterium]
MVSKRQFAYGEGPGYVTREEPDPAMTERRIRAEIGETLDQLQSLPSDAFAERSRLRDRQADLGRMLREFEIPGSEDIGRRWAEQAGAKAKEDLGHPEIVSPIESGGGG